MGLLGSFSFIQLFAVVFSAYLKRRSLGIGYQYNGVGIHRSERVRGGIGDSSWFHRAKSVILFKA